MSDELGRLLARSEQGEFRDLARALSLLEQQGPEALHHRELLDPPQTAVRIGITGPPGAGKSTLIGQIIKSLSESGHRVGVLAVDPSSPFSHGAILGDRIRYSESFVDPRVFIRSVGSRGSSGGLSAQCYLYLRAFDLWKFDYVIIETVGVGQTELEVMWVADFVVVTLVPESGDSIQAMKAGLLEIADLYVVNKADRPGSEAYAKELQESLELGGDKANVLLTSAQNGTGVSELVKFLTDAKLKSKTLSHRNEIQRLQAEARALLWWQNLQQHNSKIQKIQKPTDLLKIL